MFNKAKIKKAHTQIASGMQPKLRFPEFRGDAGWEVKRLENIASIISERAGNKKFKLMSITSGVGLVSQIEKFGREIAGLQYKNYFVINKNDFAYNKSSTKEYPEGFIAMHSDSIVAAVPNSIFTCFRIQNNKVLPKYLNYLFWNNIHGKWLRKFISIGARAHGSLNVDNADLMSLPIPLPQGQTSCKEQQKIADCLSSVDDLIGAQKQKIETLKNHKKALMQQLFPAEDETLPKLRFPEFRGDAEWEVKRLGEIGIVMMCKRIFSNDTKSEGDIPFYKIGTLGGKPDAFISKELFNLYKSKYNYPRKGEILITCSGTVGKCLQYDGRDAYYQDSNIVWIENTTIKISNDFLFSLLSKINWGHLNSTTITRIYGADLKKFLVIFPSQKKEQQKIADCLSSIDDLISLHTKKWDALKLHKKGLMQQLFPDIQEETK